MSQSAVGFKDAITGLQRLTDGLWVHRGRLLIGGGIAPIDSSGVVLGWSPLSYQNGFTSSAAPWGPAGYRKLATGLVKLRGLITTPTPLNVPVTIAILPAGYRPSINQAFACATQTGAQQLDVGADGNLQLGNEVKGGTALGPGMWCSINEITFVVDQ